MSEGRGKGCFKVGCTGCLLVIAALVGVGLLFGAIHLTTDWGDPNPEQRAVERELPAAPPLPNLPELPDAPPGSGELPAIPIAPLPADFDPSEVRAGVLELDLNMGEFIIQPGPAGEPIRVEADYDTSAFELSESYDERGDGTWKYKIGFGSKGGWFGLLLRGGSQGRNRVTITVPRDQPLDIVGTIGTGQSEIDLGGLWLRDVDLDLDMGEHFLEFREPLRVPMSRFVVDSSMGSVELRGLGDASPQSVQVDHGMGEVLVDLSGTWHNDADVEVSFSMGEARLWLPETGVNIDIDRASVAMGERQLRVDETTENPDHPTLTLRLSGSMGELQVKQ